MAFSWSMTGLNSVAAGRWVDEDGDRERTDVDRFIAPLNLIPDYLSDGH
jgi:hypothetical protein